MSGYLFIFKRRISNPAGLKQIMDLLRFVMAYLVAANINMQSLLPEKFYNIIARQENMLFCKN
jgi:hypothetical protein